MDLSQRQAQRQEPIAEYRTSDADSGAPSALHKPIREAMQPALVTVDGEMGILELLKLLVNQGVSGAPVIDQVGRPVGFVSTNDILRELAANPGAALRQPLEMDVLDTSEPDLSFESRPARRVSHFMSPVTISVTEEASVAETVALMARENTHRVLVLEGDGRVAGIVWLSDVVRCLAHHVPSSSITDSVARH